MSRGLLSVETVHEGDDSTTLCYSVDENTRELASTAIFADGSDSESKDDWHQKIGRRLIRSGIHTQIAIDQFLLAQESILESARLLGDDAGPEVLAEATTLVQLATEKHKKAINQKELILKNAETK